jgi:hypothetical protein
MGADNWGICPRCKRAAEAKKQQKREAAAKVYGKVPPDEWRRMCDAAEAVEELEETLREDYEQHTNEDGEFFVSYHCRCTKCDFKHTFKHTEQLNLDLSQRV